MLSLAAQPPRQVHDLHPIAIRGLVMRAGKNHLGIRIANAQQWRNLAFKRLIRADVVAHLNVELLASLDCYKVYFLL